jgi:large subunit ribosomal protein L32
MAAVPKKKTSQSRKGNRRQHIRLTIPAIVPCSHCRNPKLRSHVCPTCGYYRGREVIAPEPIRPAAE